MPDNGKLRTIGKTGKIGKMGGIGKIDRIGTGNNRESTYGIRTGNQHMVSEQAITEFNPNMLWLTRQTVNSQQVQTPPIRDFLEEKL